jgi:diguanylate cyclase (GGDEF)-like protein
VIALVVKIHCTPAMQGVSMFPTVGLEYMPLGPGEPRREPTVRDPLTGLANWHLFTTRAATALARAAHRGVPTALVVVDIDQFHHFNDQFGHETGDLVLMEVARRLTVTFGGSDTEGRPGNIIGRLGGDEFILMCENVADLAAARILGRRVAEQFTAPVELLGVGVLLTVRVGIALASPGQVDIEELIVEAESAMRRSKQRGRGAHTVFAADMRDCDSDTDERAQDLQRALPAGEFRLFYQPKVALDTDLIVGTEALLRWQHPERGLVTPADFIPLAEQTGLIVAIGDWVIAEACLQASRWHRSFPDRPALVVSVNVSPRQFGPGLVDVVAAALAAAGTDPKSLCLEVTESVLMNDVEGSVAILEQIAALGVEVSIDDFGTGYSSLAYLKHFPLTELKIDKSFVDGLGNDGDDTAIVAAVIALAHALDLCVVAEGVETAEQLQRLRTLGCEQAQGFLFARPGPPQAIDDLLIAAGDASWRNHPRAVEGTDVATAATYRPDRILVIDDDSDVRLLVMMSLTAVGFEVHQAADGTSALASAALNAPDCVLLDLNMPGIGGLEVCRALRRATNTANCTIMMLTATDSASDKVDAFSAGADDYITKPFSPRDLAGRVHSAMRRRREANGRGVAQAIVERASSPVS